VSEGSVSYFVDFRVSGRRRRVAIGNARQSTLAAARELANEILAAARHGEDLTVDRLSPPHKATRLKIAVSVVRFRPWAPLKSRGYVDILQSEVSLLLVLDNV